MTIDEYFSTMERGLRQNPLVSHLQNPFDSIASDDYNGLVRVRIFFWDDSFLDIYEVATTERSNGSHTFRIRRTAGVRAP